MEYNNTDIIVWEGIICQYGLLADIVDLEDSDVRFAKAIEIFMYMDRPNK